MNIERRDLPEQAARYVRERLAHQGLLSQLLAARDFGRAAVWAYLPTAVSDAVAADPAHAGIMYAVRGRPTPRPTLERVEQFGADQTYKAIGDRVRATPGGCLVVEDFLRQPSDRAVQVTKVPYFVAVEQVYYFVADHDVTPTTIHDAIAAGKFMWLTAFVGADSGVLSAVSRGEAISDDQLRVLSASVSMVVMLAWDGEGYLICDRPASTAT